MILYKDNFITKHIFEALMVGEPDIAMKMIRNKMVVKSDRERVDEHELNAWLRENCDGLIYFIDEGDAYRDHYIYYFEKEEEAVAFKLRWS